MELHYTVLKSIFAAYFSSNSRFCSSSKNDEGGRSSHGFGIQKLLKLGPFCFYLPCVLDLAFHVLTQQEIHIFCLALVEAMELVKHPVGDLVQDRFGAIPAVLRLLHRA